MNIEYLYISFYIANFFLPGIIIRSTVTLLNPTRKSSDIITFLYCFMYSLIHLAIWSWAYISIIDLYINNIIPDIIYFILISLISIVGSLTISIGIIIQNRIRGYSPEHNENNTKPPPPPPPSSFGSNVYKPKQDN